MTEIKEFKLIGLALKSRTTNKNAQSSIDCGNLWQTFHTGGYAQKIPDKKSDEIYAVYYNYEGDYTRPFSFFIGCKVEADTEVPDGMDSLIIPNGNYQLFKTSGEIPGCISKAWGVIWCTNFPRKYHVDFEVYGEKSLDRNKAEVNIYVSVK
jgi:predicted transcriptional regulator YdeE